MADIDYIYKNAGTEENPKLTQILPKTIASAVKAGMEENSPTVEDAINGINADIDNKADKTLATASADGLMPKEDKSKLDNIEAAANHYVHPDTSGSKHIPAGGATGKVLGWEADGTAKWTDPPAAGEGGANKDIFGDNNVSFGRKAGTTVGENSFCYGKDNEASGKYSVATGCNNIASGDSAYASGNSELCFTPNAYVEKLYNVASGNGARSVGAGTTASGDNSNACGFYTTAEGENSFSIGSETEAKGKNAFSVGDSTQANGINSIAEGSGTVASGTNAHAAGEDSYADGRNSFALGSNVSAWGDNSFAQGGDYTEAKGVNAFARGKGILATGENQTALGKYNVEDKNNQYAFIIGGGTDDSHRKNIAAVDWQGNATYAGDVISKSGASLDGLKTAIDAKVDYVHPETHPATMITEDDQHKFVTANEKQLITNPNICVLTSGELSEVLIDDSAPNYVEISTTFPYPQGWAAENTVVLKAMYRDVGGARWSDITADKGLCNPISGGILASIHKNETSVTATKWNIRIVLVRA